MFSMEVYGCYLVMRPKKVRVIEDFFCDYCKDHGKKHEIKFLHESRRTDIDVFTKFRYQCTGCKRKVYASERF